MKIRVMLAEDQNLVREGLRSLLELSDHIEVVGEVEDGSEVLAGLERCKPDVLLIDIRMPRMTGIEALQAMQEKGVTTPAIILTTFDDHQLVLEGMRAGAKGYLLKDVSLESLVNTIEKVQQGETLVQPVITERIMKGLASLATSQEFETPVDELSPKELQVLRLMATVTAKFPPPCTNQKGR